MPTDHQPNSLLQKLAQHNHLHWFPLPAQLKGYDRTTFAADASAGLNVALLTFPQGMAYAAIAGLPIQFGIYGSIIAAFLCPLWSGSRLLAAGPTNSTAVLIFAAFLTLGYTDEYARLTVLPLIVALSGIFLIFGALIKVASLVQYVSRSVVTGYITAAAFFIILNQLKKALGYDFELPAGSSFFDVILLTLKNLTHTHWPTLGLSLGAGGAFFFLNRKLKTLPNVAIILTVFSFIGFSLNQFCHDFGWGNIQTLSAIDVSQWTLTIPPFSVDLVRKLASMSFVIAFLTILEGSSICKTLAARSGEKVDLNQEVLGLGIANLGCAFFQGMAASGSLTRSQLNDHSGARTGVASVLSSLFCLVGALALGSFVRFIPICVLAAIIIFIGFSLFNRHIIRVVWYSTANDRMVFATTFVAALLVSLDFGIILGVALSILLFLRQAAKPELIEYTQNEEGRFTPITDPASIEATPEVSIVHVEGDLFFGAAELFHAQMRRACNKPNLKIVVLKMRNAHHLDATSVLALEDLVRFMQANGRYLIISEIRDDAERIFKASGLDKIIGPENLFLDDMNNFTLSTSKALRRSMQLLNGQDAEVKIFVGSQKRKPSESD